MMNRKFWIAVAALSVIYIFIPEPTDVIPILGWLDEASAFAILTYALKQLDIPIFNKVFGTKSVKTKL
jgi:hypothetical protein